MVRSYGPDPRFGLRTTVESTTTTFGSHTAVVAASRTATLADESDPFTLETLSDTVEVNGRPYTTVAERDGSGDTFTLTATTPANRQTVTRLDSAGRVSRVELPGVLPTDLLYDLRGRLEEMTQGTRTWSFGYDADGNLASVENPLSQVTGFEYDPASRVERQILPGPGSRDIVFEHDESGNMSLLKPPAAPTPPARPEHGFEFTAVELERLYSPPQPLPPLADPRTYYEYEPDRQLELVVRPDGGTIEWVYDAVTGKLTSQILTATDPPSVLSYAYAYDSQTGELATITAPHGGTLTFEKTANAGLLTRKTTWGGASPVQGSVTQVYDADDRLVSEQVNQEPPVTFGYDQDGLITSATLPGGQVYTITRDPASGRVQSTQLGVVADSTTYNAYGEVESYTATANGTPIFQVSYTRDQLGRIASKTESVEQEPPVTYAYTYDEVGRLTDVHTTTTQGTSHTAHYAYDANGNRIPGQSPPAFNQEHGELLEAHYDAQDRLLEYDTAGHGETDFSYSANGEVTAEVNSIDGTTSYEYDHLGNLRRVVLPDQSEVEYLIDGRNRRIGRKVDGVFEQGFLYRDQLEPVAEFDAAGNLVSEFVYATNPHSPDAMTKNGTMYRLIKDHLGSVRLVVDAATGAVVEEIAYDEFGWPTSPSVFQPFGFAGGETDEDTGLTRFGARDYSPWTGRWHSKDPMRFAYGELGLYEYASSDPLNGHDPAGTFSLPVPAGEPVYIPPSPPQPAGPATRAPGPSPTLLNPPTPMCDADVTDAPQCDLEALGACLARRAQQNRSNIRNCAMICSAATVARGKHKASSAACAACLAGAAAYAYDCYAASGCAQ